MYKCAIIFTLIACTFIEAQEVVSPTNKPPSLNMLTEATATQKEQGSVLMVAAAERGQDIVDAFQYFKKVSVGSKIALFLTGNTHFTDILDLTLMPQKTLFIVKMNSMKGIHYQVVKVEDVLTLTIIP